MDNLSLIKLALAVILTQGEEAVKRAFTPPEAWVRRVCAKTKADPVKALEERDESATAWAAFMADMVGVVAVPQVAEDLGLGGVQTAQAQLPNLETNLLGIGITMYRLFGRSMVQRMLTVPESAVKAICAKTGADVQEVLAARNAATEELLEFIEAMADKGFVDPD